MGYVEGGGPNQGGEISETHTQTVCKFVDTAVPIDTCLSDYDVNGNCNGGGRDGGGYTYTKPIPEEEDCEKIEKTGKKMKRPKTFSKILTKRKTL